MADNGVMWEASEPVTVEMLAGEIGVDLEQYCLRIDGVGVEHVDMMPSVGLVSVHNAEADVWRLEYSLWHKRFCNVRTREVTVVQIESGGSSGCEGWGACNRWLVGCRLSEREVTVLLPLLEAGIVPEHTFFEEL